MCMYDKCSKIKCSFTDCGAHTNAGKMAKQLISALGALANGHSISVSLFNSCVCSVVFTRISLNTLSFKFQLKIPNVAGICFVWLVFFRLSSSPFFRHRFNPQRVHWNHNQCVTCCSGDLQTPPKMSIHSISSCIINVTRTISMFCLYFVVWFNGHVHITYGYRYNVLFEFRNGFLIFVFVFFLVFVIFRFIWYVLCSLCWRSNR